MKPRLWANAAAVWTAFYVALYSAVVHGSQGPVAVVYGLIVVVAGLLVLPTGLLGPSLRRTNLMLVALVLYVLATLWATLGGGPFGLLLVPAIVATARSLSKLRRGEPPKGATAR